VAAFRAKAAINTQQEYLRRWDRQLQLKLMRSDAFSNCLSLLTRRYFKEWINYSRLYQVVEIKDYKRHLDIAVIALSALKKNRIASKTFRAISTAGKAKTLTLAFK